MTITFKLTFIYNLLFYYKEFERKNDHYSEFNFSTILY